MSVRATKMKQTRSFRLESLEDRSLLSVAIPSSPVAEVQPMKTPQVVTHTITGQVTGTFHEVTSTSVTLNAKGNLAESGTTVLLPVTLSGSYRLKEAGRTLKWNMTAGTATFTDSAGDAIKVKFTGSGQPTSPYVFQFSVKGTVTGGSGQFHGATGTFSASGKSYNALGLFTMNVSLTVKTK